MIENRLSMLQKIDYHSRKKCISFIIVKMKTVRIIIKCLKLWQPEIIALPCLGTEGCGGWQGQEGSRSLRLWEGLLWEPADSWFPKKLSDMNGKLFVFAVMVYIGMYMIVKKEVKTYSTVIVRIRYELTILRII